MSPNQNQKNDIKKFGYEPSEKELKIGSVRVQARVVKVREIYPRVLILFRKFDKKLKREVEIPVFFGDTLWSDFVEFLRPVFEEYRRIKRRKKIIEIDSQRFYEVGEGREYYYFTYKRFDPEDNRWITGKTYAIPKSLGRKILRDEVLENE